MLIVCFLCLLVASASLLWAVQSIAAADPETCESGVQGSAEECEKGGVWEERSVGQATMKPITSMLRFPMKLQQIHASDY